MILADAVSLKLQDGIQSRGSLEIQMDIIGFIGLTDRYYKRRMAAGTRDAR